MPCSGARWRTCLSNGNAPGTRAAGAGGRIEGKAYLPKGSGLIRLNFEEVAGRRFDPCRRMEVDGGVGPDLHAARGNEGCSVRISTNVCAYGLGRARATSSHRVCVGTTFTESWDWRSEVLPWVRMSQSVDMGGTFTDVVLPAADGSLHALKLLSSPDDYGRATARARHRGARGAEAQRGAPA